MTRRKISVLAEIAVFIAIMAAFLWFTLNSAVAQYGNVNDPYLDHQREQREIESLELQRRQVEVLEQQLILRRFDVLYPRPMHIPACDPYLGVCYP
jgi:hypothetical protein